MAFMSLDNKYQYRAENAFTPFALACSYFESEGNLLDSRRRSRSTGLTNFSQSCVPLGTMRSSCSATTIPSAYDRLVLLIVVMKSEPPGCKTNTKSKTMPRC